MEPLDQIPLDRGPEPPPPPAAPEGRDGRTRTRALVAAALLLAVGAFVYWRSLAPAPEGPAEAQPEPVAVAPPAPADEVVDLPALDLSDPLVRRLLSGLSNRPELVAWLATDGLIRNFVVSVDNVAEGTSPARHLRPLAPAAKFQVRVERGALRVDEDSYARYNGIADTLASLDPQALAKVYATLEPRLDEAYRELGHPDSRFLRAVEAAIVHLLRTPVTPEAVMLTEGVLSYEFAQDSLEDLSAAQKQLLRMGPRNMRLVQEQLRAVAAALGIPEARLPAAGGGR
jgi:hypothetical protein